MTIDLKHCLVKIGGVCMKIANRFTSGSFITIHDELFMDLIKLNTATAKFNIVERVICGEKYLMNLSIKDNRYEVGLMVKVPNELVDVGVDLDRLTNFGNDQYAGLYKSMSESLTFSSEEVLVTSILFSHYLNNSNANNQLVNQLTFKDIERYRGKSSAKRNEVIKDETANGYKRILQSLCSKLVFLNTTESFRDFWYGVNNKTIMHRFLEIDSVCSVGSNNFQFNYSFGNYGKFIKRSRRYSNILPSKCYSYNFNQANKHRVALFIAQILFYEGYMVSKGKRKFPDCIIEAVRICEWTYGKYNISAKEFKMFRKYMEDILQLLHQSGEIAEYAVCSSVRPGRREKRHDVSYQINLLNRMKRNEVAVGNLTPTLYKNESNTISSYPNITSYALLSLPTGSED